MSNNYRSKVTYEGKIMAGARALWKATGVKDGDFGKPIIAVANSFTQFVPGLHSGYWSARWGSPGCPAPRSASARRFFQSR